MQKLCEEGGKHEATSVKFFQTESSVKLKCIKCGKKGTYHSFDTRIFNWWSAKSIYNTLGYASEFFTTVLRITKG